MSKETIYIAMELSDKFNVAFPDGFIPEGIIDKTKCRVGITYTAFHEKRHTIITVPTAPIIEDAKLDYPELNLFAVMDGVTPEMVADYLQSNVRHLKIVSTPDSFWKIINVARGLGKLDWLFENVFLYNDENHCYATEAFREGILTPFDDDTVWKFKKRAFGSATPYPFSDPRYEEMQRYKLVYKERFGKITIINDPNPKSVLNHMITNRDMFFPGKVFIMFNSVTQSGQAITDANIIDESTVFCRDDERNMINLQEAHVCYRHQPMPSEYKKFNFFSRRYNEGWSLKDDETATIILVTDVHSPHTMVGIPFQGFQAIGRIEQRPYKIYHITNNYGKENMRTFDTMKRNWDFYSGSYVQLYNSHRLDCKANGIDNDGLMKEMIKPFSKINDNDEAELSREKLDQVIYAEWFKEHYSNVNTIQQAWSDLNYDTELQSFYLRPIIRNRKSKENINRQMIERLEDFKSHPERYVYEIAKATIAKDKVEFQLLFEAYHMLGLKEIEKLNYNDKAMKEALIETSNKNADAKLRLILIAEYKLNSRHTKNSMKIRLQELYDQFGIKKMDGTRKIAKAEDFKDFGLFMLKECKAEDLHGTKKPGFEIMKLLYQLKQAA